MIITSDVHNKQRIIKTFALYASFVVVGLTCAIIGPSLLDLQLALSTTYEEIAYALSGRSSGYALGSFISKFANVLCKPFSTVLTFCTFFCFTIRSGHNLSLRGHSADDGAQPDHVSNTFRHDAIQHRSCWLGDHRFCEWCRHRPGGSRCVHIALLCGH